MSTQAVVFHLSADLSRRLRQFVGENLGYATINEFAEVALENQLNLEAGIRDDRAAGCEVGSTETDQGDAVGWEELLLRPEATRQDVLDNPGDGTDGTLFVLTNRLSPMKIGTRVLANLAKREGWPDLEEFHATSSAVARYLGLKLKSGTDRQLGDKPWIGYPIGADADKAKARYAASFTAAPHRDSIRGPMVLLGLIGLRDGRILLTRNGWRLAAAPSPLVDGAEGRALSAPEIDVFLDAIRSAPRELEEVQKFVHVVQRTGGLQGDVDELLAREHPDWTPDLAIAHRSAMLGRLRDLELLRVQGRGPRATIHLQPAVERLASSTPATA